MPDIKIIDNSAIGYKSSMTIPVVSIPYIESKVDNMENYKLIGVGLSPNIEHCGPHYCKEVPFGVSVSYKSFTRRKLVLSFFYLYYELISTIN